MGYALALAGACTPVRREVAEEPPTRIAEPGPMNALRPAPQPEVDHALLGRVLVLGYDDFGPQAMAFALLGMAWHPWEDPLHEPVTIGDGPVEVVVFHDVARARVERAFPTSQATGRDVRFVEASAALAFLDAEIAGLAAEDGQILVDLRQRITRTRGRIHAAFPAARPEPAAAG
jgi:hypothetical protein